MLPLHGVTILDISRLLPGGYASLLLRELGATVIKIEQPGVGDYYRVLLKDKPLLNVGHLDAIHAGKKCLGLDLKSPEGRGIFLKLVRKSRVVIENFRPGVLKKLGIAYPVLRKTNPEIILCSITGLGQKGPISRMAGHDLNYLGLSGLLTRIRDEEGRMVVPDFQVIDLAAGQEAAMRICAALVRREKTKKGCWIDCSMLESGYSMARLYPSGRIRGRGLIRYGIYETADKRHVTLAALEPKFWNKFCRLAGHPEWADAGARYEYLGDEKKEELKKIFRSKTSREWTDLGRREDLCLFPVVPIEELPLPPPKKVPPLGAHTEEILRAVGYRKDQIGALRTKGVKVSPCK